MVELLKNTPIVRLQGDEFLPVNAADELKDKIVALYFSGSWCGPCCNFTPKLKEFYNALKGYPLEIVFVSRDNDENAMKEYMQSHHGSWLAIKFGDPANKELKEKFQVYGIPTLTVVKPNGEVINEDAVGEVDNDGSKTPLDVIKEWKEAAGL